MYNLLQPICQNLWHAQHKFSAYGVPISSRMTVAKLGNGDLWVHSPIPLHKGLKKQLDALGTVRHVIAPNKNHYLYAADFVQHFPMATLHGAQGLSEKSLQLKHIKPIYDTGAPWSTELESHLFNGIPALNETVWYHKPSKSLILTDLCQWWQEEFPWVSKYWANIMGVRDQMDVPLSLRLMIEDKDAAHQSALSILHWPFERIIMSHNTIVEDGARAHLMSAFKHFR